MPRPLDNADALLYHARVLIPVSDLTRLDSRRRPPYPPRMIKRGSSRRAPPKRGTCQAAGSPGIPSAEAETDRVVLYPQPGLLGGAGGERSARRAGCLLVAAVARVDVRRLARRLRAGRGRGMAAVRGGFARRVLRVGVAVSPEGVLSSRQT